MTLFVAVLAGLCAFVGLAILVVSYLATFTTPRLDAPQFAARMLFPFLFFAAAITLHVLSR